MRTAWKLFVAVAAFYAPPLSAQEAERDDKAQPGDIIVYGRALEQVGIDFEVQDYSQRARTAGDDADAACYIYADVDGTSAWGVGIAGSTTRASLEAIVSAVNRSTAAN